VKIHPVEPISREGSDVVASDYYIQYQTEAIREQTESNEKIAEAINRFSQVMLRVASALEKLSQQKD